ncbi:MAG: amino acid adenylation domain-containing protein, partial [Myxococcota bacterium]
PDPAHLGAADPVEARDPTERLLAGIWQQVLRVGRVGLHDDFFELGGDSILSLQIAARAHAVGLKISSRQILQHPTVARLLEVAGVVGAPVPVEPEPEPADPLPLTPIQRWFAALDPVDPHHWNRSIRVALQRPIAADELEAALDALAVRHDALRLRFDRTPSGWSQRRAATTAVPLDRLDLRGAPDPDSAWDRAIDRLQASLDLADGPVVRAALVERDAEPPELVLIAHHLVIDVVSWTILLEDLEATLTGASTAAPAVSFARWATRLAAIDRSSLGDEGYWLDDRRARVATLPLDRDAPTDADVHGDTDVVHVSLTPSETAAVLHAVPPVYRTQVVDLLLTAVALAIRDWTGDGRVLVELEGHGRGEILDELDLSRTVGWFTSAYPVLVDLPDATSGSGPIDALKAVKDQLRAVPRGGIGYGLARYLGEPALRDRLAALPRAEIVLDYVGQLRAPSPDSLFGATRELGSSSRSPRGRRPQRLQITAAVQSGRLEVGWEYARAVHDRTTIVRVADAFLAAVRAIVAHCTAPGAGGFTPSDFPLAGLDQRRLDLLAGRSRAIEDVYPLSSMQEGMLFHSLYAPGTGVYVGHSRYQLTGPLDVTAFVRAWQRVMERHPSLRSGFAWEGLRAPLQLVHRELPVPMVIHDWRRSSPAEQEARLDALAAADRVEGYALSDAPLFRLHLITTDDDRHQLLWSMHHAQFDGWSMGLITRDLWACYEAFLRGASPVLEVARPYRDYVAWLAARDPRASEPFWRATLRGLHEPTALRIGGGEVGDGPEASRYHERSVALTDHETAALHQFGRIHRLTFATVLQGCWAIVAALYAGTDDVVFGSVVSGRPEALADVGSIVGLFINTLPARVRIDRDAPVVQWLQALQERQLEARRHEHTPLQDIQRWSEVPPGTPLFESIVVDNTAWRSDRVAVAGLEVRELHSFDQTNYPLTVVATRERAIGLLISFDAARFGSDAVSRLLEHLRSLIVSVAADDVRTVGALSPLTDTERRTLLGDWRGPRFDYDRAALVHRRIAAFAALTPDAPAVAGGSESLTHAALNTRANQLAHHLRALGVGPDVPVGVCLERTPAAVVAMLAVLKAGGAYLPMDHGHPPDRLGLLVRHAAAPVVITEARLVDAFSHDRVQVVVLDRDAPAIGLRPTHDPNGDPHPDHRAYIVFTSGSTGTPKGVELTHGALVNRVAWYGPAYGVIRDDRASQFFSLAFDVTGWEIWPHLAYGASVCLMDDDVRLDPRRIQAWLLDRRITICNLPTTLSEALLDLEWPEDTPLRVIQTGGEKLRRRPEPRIPFRLVNNYGPTENTVTSTWYPVATDGPEAPPIGRPLGNTRVYVLDPRMDLAPIGIAGELCLGGDSLARGYLNRPDLTAERFVPDPFASGERLYRTGDLVRWRPDGDLEFLGRIDHQVKIRGFRIEPGEIEVVLAEHPSVREAAVVVRSDGEQQLVAYLVPDGPAPGADALRAWLQDKLPAYMIPAAFVTMAALPLNSSGKVDHRALPAPTVEDRSQRTYTAPRTAVEGVLATVWAEVLGIDRVGVDDDFFALGGHSLLATRVISQLHERLGVAVPIRALFDAPTIAGLAATLATGVAATDPRSVRDAPIGPRDRTVTAPLSFAQQRLWFLDQLEQGASVYVIPDALVLDGVLDVDALRRSLDEVVRRHESLRTTYREHGGEPVQVVADHLTIPLPVRDLRHLPSDDRMTEAMALATVEARRPFDLATGPLLRAALLRIADDAHVLLLTLHHIVTDGWSTGILVTELTAAYTAFCRGAPCPLPPLPIQYADFAVWQHRWLTGTVLEAQTAYWRRQLGGRPAPLALPLDRPRPPVQSYEGASLTIELPLALTEALEALARRTGASLFMTLIAGFSAVLSTWARQTDISIGTPIANRNRSELDPLIGFFVNTLVLRIDLTGDPTAIELLSRVRDTCLEGYAHQDIPFERLVEVLQPDRDMSRSPLFQVMFALQNADMGTWDLPGLTARTLEIPADRAPFDLDIEFVRRPHGLVGTVVYATALFDAATIGRLADHLCGVYERIVADPHARLWATPWITGPERATLDRWNATDAPFPGDRCVHHLFEAHAAANPDQLAVVADDGVLTYRELDQRADRLAHHLVRAGVGPDRIVAVCLDRTPALIVALFAILKAGAAYVPLDPAY